MKKIIAYIGMVLLSGIACCSLVAGVYMVDKGFYQLEKDAMKTEELKSIAENDAYNLTWQYLLGCEEYVENECQNYRNIDVRVKTDKGIYASNTMLPEKVTAYDFDYTYDDFNVYYTTDGEMIFQGEVFADEIAKVEVDVEQLRIRYMKDAMDDEYVDTLSVESEEYISMEEYYNEEFLYYLDEEGLETLTSWHDLKSESIKTTVYMDTSYPILDGYSITNKMIDIAYNVKTSVWVVAGISTLLTVLLFIYLLVTAGKKKGVEEAILSGTAVLPWDVVVVTLFMIGCICFTVGVAGIGDSGGYSLLVGSCMGFVSAFAIGVLLLMDFIARVRTKTVLKNILVIRIWKVIRPFSRAKQAIKWVIKMINKVFSVIPLIWKWLIIYCSISFLALITGLFSGSWLQLLHWIFINVLVFPIVAYVCIVFDKLRKGSKAVADGDLETKINDKYMIWEFKDIANHMNSLGDGLEKAVEKQMKSERFKTELISNVSHDIKTPLTSIINYSDLISKEETDNEKIKEYSGILLKQAERLKKLTEDLVDASKASTGNVEVNLAPCELGVLIAQTVGEFQQKLQEQDLELISRHPEVPVFVMADGKLIWRVFDNLFNNICKYAQSGTRVYLTVELMESQVVVSFKNTSKYALDISADELLERFVRGDASRHSEGNGLGLSIAKSLIEVQGGSFELVIDGDLFKAVLGFDKI